MCIRDRLAGVPWTVWQMHAHGWEVKSLPPGAAALQFTDRCKIQSFRAGMRTYGFQYHFECDLGMIADLLNCGSPQIAQAGVEPEAAMAAAREHYAEYARVSDRICENLATYLFPVFRAISA
jgi:GMP synthase-like glutamine amidotransferase